MEFTEEHKKQVEKMIVDTVIDALGAQAIPESELQPIAGFVLDKIDNIKTVEELGAFLKELVSKWSFFLPIERFLEAEVKHEGEQELIDKAEDLVKNGNVNEALALLKEEQINAGNNT